MLPSALSVVQVLTFSVPQATCKALRGVLIFGVSLGRGFMKQVLKLSLVYSTKQALYIGRWGALHVYYVHTSMWCGPSVQVCHQFGTTSLARCRVLRVGANAK